MKYRCDQCGDTVTLHNEFDTWTCLLCGGNMEKVTEVME